MPDLLRWSGVKFLDADRSAAYRVAALVIARQYGGRGCLARTGREELREDFLREFEDRDNVFPEIDYSVYR